MRKIYQGILKLFGVSSKYTVTGQADTDITDH